MDHNNKQTTAGKNVAVMVTKEEAKAESEIEVEVDDKIEQTTSNVEYTAVFTYERIVQATEIGPAPLEAIEEAKDKAVVVKMENTAMEDMIINHIMHSSINTYLCLLLKDKEIYHLLQWHW